MLGGLSQYAFLNAKVRGKMSRLLNEEQVRALAECADLEHALVVLKDTQYAALVNQISEPPSLAELERFLILDEASTYHEIASLTHGAVEEVFEILESWYELEELKGALRAWVRTRAGVPSDFTPLGVSDLPLEEIVEADSLEQIGLILKPTPYASSLLAAAPVFQEKKSAFVLEIALDQSYYRRLWSSLDALSDRDKRVASRLVGIEVDLKNLQWILRGLMYYRIPAAELLDDLIPHGWRIQPNITRKALEKQEVGDVLEQLALGPYQELMAGWLTRAPRESAALLEGILWEILLGQVRLSLAGFPFTIGTPLAYCFLKRLEVQNLIRLLESIELQMPPQEFGSSPVNVR